MNYAATLFEQAMSELRDELAADGCPEIVISRTIESMRRDFAGTSAKIKEMVTRNDQ